MRLLMAFPCVAVLALTGCSFFTEDAAAPAPINAPEPAKAVEGAKRAATEAKLTEPLEVTSVRKADPLSPGPYIVCVRGAASEKTPRYTYAVFFKNNDFVSSRMSVLIDDCEAQAFSHLKK